MKHHISQLLWKTEHWSWIRDTNRTDAGTSSLTCCSFSFTINPSIFNTYSFLSPGSRRGSLSQFIEFHSSQQNPKITLENKIGWHYIFKCPTSFSAGIVCPHAQSSRDAIVYWVKFPASVNGLPWGQSRQGRPDISTPGRVAVYQPPHELTTTAAETPPCWSWALPCSLSQPFSMSGVHFANALQNLLSARQGWAARGMCCNRSLLFSADVFADCSNLLSNCWEQFGFGIEKVLNQFLVLRCFRK